MARPRRSRRARRRRALRFAALGLVLAVAVVGALAARDALAVRRRVGEARGVLSSLTASTDELATVEGRAAALARIDAAEADLRGGLDVAQGSMPLRLVALAPGVGYQRAGAIQLIEDGSSAAIAARTVLRAADEFQAGRIQQGTVPLDRVQAFEAALAGSARELRRVTRGQRGLWGQLGEARRELDGVVGPAATRLQDTADTAAALRGFLGQQGARRYFVAGLNNAEMRSQGMVLSFAVVRFDGGRMSVERTDPIETIEIPAPAPVELPAGTAAVFGPLRPTQQWRSVNATADFSLTARTIVAMYAEATKQQLDGVIALDVPALAALLGVVGPVELPGLGPLSEESAPPFLLSRQYEGTTAGAQRARRERVADVARLVAERLAGADIDTVTFGRRMGDAAAGRHLLLWSREQTEAEAFERAGIGGGPVAAARGAADRTFHVAVQEAGATKLDYLVRPELAMEVILTKGGSAVVRTRVRVRNEAPVGAAPSYVLGPNSPATDAPGQYVTRIYHWGPAGASQLEGVPESGLLLSSQAMLVEPSSAGEVMFETIIPNAVRNGELSLRVVPQPRHAPVPLEARLRIEGRDDSVQSVQLDRTRTISWPVGG